MPAVLVSHRDCRETMELARPLGVDPVPGAVIAEACSVGDQPLGPKLVAEEYGLAAEPRVAKVPDLVTADDDHVILARTLRLVQRETARKRQGGNGAGK